MWVGKTTPGTKCPSFWEPGAPYHKHRDWSDAILGTNPDKQILVGFWEISRFVFLTMFHFANDGVAYENHSTIMQVQQADLMRAWATTPCSFVFQNQKNP